MTPLNLCGLSEISNKIIYIHVVRICGRARLSMSTTQGNKNNLKPSLLLNDTIHVVRVFGRARRKKPMLVAPPHVPHKDDMFLGSNAFHFTLAISW